MNNRWTEKEKRRLTNEYPACGDPRALAKSMDRTYKALRTMAKKLRLRRIAFAGVGRTKLTKKQDNFLVKNYLSVPPQKMADRFGVSETCVKTRIRQLGLIVPRSIIEHRIAESRIKPGSVSFNKGKRWKDYMSRAGQKASRATTFKKGQLPHNTLYDGAIRVRRDKTGIEYQYIRMGLAKWIPLHRMVWEHHRGKIPRKHCVIFKDGNQGNCNIKNLQLITLRENMLRNTVHNYPKEIVQIVQLRGAINRQINKHLKHEKQNQRSAQPYVRAARKT